MTLRTTTSLMFALLATGSAVALATRPTVSAPHTGFLVGDQGDLRPAAPKVADFTMAADGITIITVAWADCFGIYGPGDFRLDMMSGPVNEDGGVATTPDGTRQDIVTIPAAFIDGCWYAEGYYRVPDEFNRGSDENVPSRGINFEAKFIPQSGGPAILTIFVDLMRPPVVFVHGLWSGPTTWRDFDIASASILPIRVLADYAGDPAASSFSTNKRVVYDSIEKALEECRDAEIRCTRVDVVGHSMGGLLTRIHSNSPLFATALNRHHGNVRKLITLDTPHTGSPLADLLAILAVDPSPQGFRMRALFDQINKPIDEGAIYDLATISTPITTLQECPIPSHALVGVGGPELLGTVYRPMGPLYRALFLASVVTGTDVFGPLQHDTVVGRLSQEGGLPASATTSFGFPDGIHFGIPLVTTGNTGSAAYSERVRELLDTPTSESVWSLLPANARLQTIDQTVAVPRRPEEPANEKQPEGGVDFSGEGTFDLTITSPAPGTIVTPGTSITVTVSVAPGVTVDQIVVAGKDEAINDTSAPFEVSFPIPLEAFRTYTIEAFGKNDMTNEYFQSESVNLVAQPATALQSLEINPTEAFIVGPEDTLRLFVIGIFADGVPREVPPADVTWTSLNPGIATIASDGTATGVAVGTATVRADSQSLQATRIVKVLPRPPLVFVDNFESGDTSEWSLLSP